MKKFSTLLLEEPSHAQKKAIELGLKYRGFGYWQDPRTGRTTYKTKGDELVPIEKEKQDELEKKDGGGGLTEPNATSQDAMSPGPTAGTNVGPAPEPGQERAPDEEDPELGWDPGPDGDNMIDGQEKDEEDEIAADAYVGRNNDINWVAGPDGSNYKKLSFDEMITEAESYLLEANPANRTSFWKNMPIGANLGPEDMAREHRRYNPNTPEADATEYWKNKGLTPNWAQDRAKIFRERNKATVANQPNVNQPIDPSSEDEMEPPSIHDMAMSMLGFPNQARRDMLGNNDGAETQLQNVRDNTGGTTELKAASAIRKVGDQTREDELEDLEDIKNRPNGEYTRALRMKKELKALPQKLKDREIVKKMNEDIRQLVTDPTFDLNTHGLTDVGEGSFGTAFITPDGNHVVKNGYIGAKEIKVLNMLQHSPYFPRFVNGEFTEPFGHNSSVRNNPSNNPRKARQTGQSKYFNPSQASEFTDEFPSASGRFAMTRAPGKMLVHTNKLYGQELQDASLNVWRARAEMHINGISHNDLHGGNIFIDGEGKITVIDFGLANDDPMSALQEALGGFEDNYGHQADYQLAYDMRFSNLSDDIANQLNDNLDEVLKELKDRLGIQDDYDRGWKDFIKGGIRLTTSQLKEMRENFDLTDDEIKAFIRKIYKGVIEDESPLAQKMSSEYDKRKADTDIMRAANAIRANRGASPLSIPNHVIPPHNLLRSDD